MLSVKCYSFIHEKRDMCKVEEYKTTDLTLKILLPNLRCSPRSVTNYRFRFIIQEGARSK